MKQIHEHKNWISTEVIEVLNHGLNFSSWTETYACEGKWKLEFEIEQEPKIEIYMPTSRWGEKHSGFLTLYSGHIEFIDNKIRIWQNENVPVQLNFEEFNDRIKITIFGKNIEFEKN
jgi:hypothetical protein